MTARDGLAGIWAAVLTPVDADLEPDAGKAIGYYRDLLHGGCDGVNVLGTTGEAMSLGIEQRLRFMEAIARSDLPKERIMVGTGAASLADAARLARAAFKCGFAAALVMPPFFYRDVTDDGIAAFFEALFARAQPPSKRVLLYNFPHMTGIAFRAELVDRLLAQFPEAIAGMKDSSNDRQLQAEILSRHRDLAVFPGSEAYLAEAKAYGAAGCISASVCLWPQLARDAFVRGDALQAQRVRALREALAGVSMIAAVRHLTAIARGDEAWSRPVPPLVALTEREKRLLDAALSDPKPA